MFMITVNSIYTSLINEEEYRVLWITPDNVLAYIFNLTIQKLPTTMPVATLKEQLENGEIEAKDDDPYINASPEQVLSDRDKSFRDSIWEIIKDVVENEPGIYDRTVRGPLLREISIRHSVTIMVLYKYLRWYWQRGKNKNAFLPHIHNRGGKGKSRKLSEAKIGRPSKYGVATGKNVDEATVKIFEKAVKKYYHTRQEHTFKAAYELMVKEYYTKPVEQSDGSVRNVLSSIDEIPTLRQFQYWYSKTYSSEENLLARKGKIEYALRHRAILGKSDTNITGPGAQYQIDATVGDIYLVSQFNRANIIGRPVIYFVIDTFSRMITGMYIGLEGPSWVGAMMALANAASKKAVYCADYDVHITEDEWPCCHIPDTILGDRGEMESKSVETLINTLNVRIDNAPAYRADMKGIVEQFFNTINIKTTVYLPGHVKPDMSKRGGKDYRLDAILDIRQFTKIMIQCVLNHNNEHFLKSYNRSKNMIADNVNPIPIELWKWGIQNCSGLLRTVTEDVIKLCLMPADKALVTARGVKFKGLHYISERSIYEQWFETARAKGSYKVDISYDPRDMSSIYVRNINGVMFEKCDLPDHEYKWSSKSLDELVHQQAEERALQHQYKNRELQASVDLNTEIEKVVNEAEEMARQTMLPSSKNERTSQIRENKAFEKEEIRKTETFSLGDMPKSPSAVQNPAEKPIHPITAMIKRKVEEENEG